MNLFYPTSSTSFTAEGGVLDIVIAVANNTDTGEQSALNALDHHHHTPLDRALARKHRTVVQWLIDKGGVGGETLDSIRSITKPVLQKKSTEEQHNLQQQQQWQQSFNAVKTAWQVDSLSRLGLSFMVTMCFFCTLFVHTIH